MALPGLGPLQETLQETNRLLAEVLAELRRTNTEELDAIRTEVRDLHRHLGGRPGDLGD